MNCAQCEERMSDYIENALVPGDRQLLTQHLASCAACTDLLTGMREVVAWGRNFPAYEAPGWLPARIVANTPVIARESWLDTLASIGRWIIEPRTALAIFTSVLVLGWIGGAAGISPDWGTVVRDPRTAYYQVVRAAYRSPLVTEIQSQIEQLMEIS
jgi:anti-sigma factor RsiW